MVLKCQPAITCFKRIFTIAIILYQFTCIVNNKYLTITNEMYYVNEIGDSSGGNHIPSQNVTHPMGTPDSRKIMAISLFANTAGRK